MASILNAALAYAQRGWYVFPIRAITADGGCECGEPDCDRPGKHPAVKWGTEATTDLGTIKVWWRERPDRGIGIACGEKSGITVLDIDGAIGMETLGVLQAGASMPKTPTVESRPGHRHYYFAHEPGISSEAGAIGKGIDVRNDGYYVVAPPSPHITGGAYKWTQESKVLAPWPDFLKKQETAKPQKKRGRPAKEHFNSASPKDVERLQSALEYLDPDDANKWWSIGWILGRAFAQSDAGFAVYNAWSARSRKYDRKRTKQHYYEESKSRTDGDILTTASIWVWARESGWDGGADIDVKTERAHHVYEGVIDETEMLKQFDKACGAAEGIFAKDGRLVRIVKFGLSGSDDIKRDPVAYIIHDHNQNTLSVELSAVAAFWSAKPDGNYVRSAFVRRCVTTYLDCQQYGNEIKQLAAFVSHPTLRADGSLISEVGYDAKTQLFLTSDVPGLQVDAKLTRNQALTACKTMLAPFSEYPWDSSGLNRAVFVAALFTVGLRHLFDIVPLFAFSSPKHGTGKTMLAESISLIWYGTTLSKATWTPDPEEMHKRIASFLLAGDRIVCLDNVTEGHGLEDSTLNKVLTSRRNSFRLLGRTEELNLTNDATWFATGNQLRLHGDISRRALRCYIDSHQRDPGSRKFKIPDLPQHILQHRSEILGSALSIAASWMAAGRPVMSPPPRQYGSFVGWYAFMRPLLLWCGETDIAASIDEAIEEDVEDASLNEFAETLRLNMPPDGTKLQVKDILHLINKNEALRAAFAGCNRTEPNMRSVNAMLMRCENKIFISDNPGHSFTLKKERAMNLGIVRWGIKWMK